MGIDIEKLDGREPLAEYPWHHEVDRLLEWAKPRGRDAHAFCFDVVMSLAYVDATSGLERNLEFCTNAPAPYNAHIGFINLCAPCFENENKWIYQKAVKPQSGALGKLSGEIILRFVQRLSDHLKKVIAIGGTDIADAMLLHQNGEIILAEVKSAPLITYPVLFSCGNNLVGKKTSHDKIIVTTSQLKECQSALYMHNREFIPLGLAGSAMWPFKGAVDFITGRKNEQSVDNFINTWGTARKAYREKDRENCYYYLANASGNPPKIAKDRDNWPDRESISDSKTSAGMDRTDDIKKGIYQVLKIGSSHKNDLNVKTALISNLSAYRHGDDYVAPFIEMLWGYEADLVQRNSEDVITRNKLKRVFDYIITLDAPLLRGTDL